MDKAAVAIFIFGMGSTAVTMVFHAKYPDARRWVVELLWWGGIALMVLSAGYLLYSSEMVGPDQLIKVGIIGAAIFSATAAAGYFWQQFSSPLPQTMSQPAGTAVYAAKPKLSPHYSTKDLDRISDALADISELLNNKLKPIYFEGNEILLEWGRTKNPSPLIPRMIEYRDNLGSIHEQLSSILNQKYVIYKDYLGSVLKMNPEPQLEKAITRGMDFKAKLEQVRDLIQKAPELSKDLVVLIDPQDSFFAHANNELQTWVIETNERIQKAKVALAQSQQGTE